MKFCRHLVVGALCLFLAVPVAVAQEPSDSRSTSSELAPASSSSVATPKNQPAQRAEAMPPPPHDSATPQGPPPDKDSRQSAPSEQQPSSERGPEQGDDDAGTTEKAAKAETAPAAPPNAKSNSKAKVLSKKEQLDALEALLRGELSIDLNPQDLFGIVLSDETIVNQRLKELKALLAERNIHFESKEEESNTLRANGAEPKAESKEKATSSSITESSSTGHTTGPQNIDDKLLVLRARFLSLPKEERKAVLDEHAARKKTTENEAESREAQQRAELAEQARQRALEEARRARTEAERVVAEEMARLLSVKRQQAEFDAKLADRKTAIRALEERYLSLQRRARSALSSGNTAEIVTLHAECESFAQETQDEFAKAVSYSPLRPPVAGEDRLAEAGLTIDITKVQKLRASLARDADRLQEEATEVRWLRRDQLHRALRGTNEQRLALFDVLPDELKSAELGLSATGLKRAAFEIHQVILILRYHMQVTTHWVEKVRDGHRAGGASTIMTGAVFAQLFVLLWIFLWSKKRIPVLIEAAKERGQDSPDNQSNDAARASTRALEVLSDIHRPLLFIGFLWAVYNRLPAIAQHQFEISLFYYAAIWMSSANLLIQLINSISGQHARSIHSSLATIRLRSLRLVGRTGAYIGLILSLTSQLVGRGTIYHWVIQVTWLLVVPTILLLCHWWRPLVHAYIDAERRKSPFREWVMRHKTGLVGLLGAGLAGLDLIRVNITRALRSWADEFVLARRVAAYLFQRELDRRAVEQPKVELHPLSTQLFDKLSPQESSRQLVVTSRDDECKEISVRTSRNRGGIFAVIGERGAGKSTHMRRLAENHKALILDGRESLEELERVFMDATRKSSLVEALEWIDESNEFELVIIEGAHRLIRPWIGGISEFDELISLLAPRAHRIGWVLTFEDAVWNFYAGARGTRPTFDDAIYLNGWSETEIRKLLESRSADAGINPGFHLLMSDLPKDADVIDRIEALEKAKKSFFRLIWDYAAGNPGVALHMWRRSLAISKGGDIYVQIFQAPRAEELEALPDDAAFVLRAVVQLGDASFDEITRLTRLNPRLVQDTLRYAHTEGILEPAEQGYTVTWLWYRAVTRFLHRRHLLSIRNLNATRSA